MQFLYHENAGENSLTLFGDVFIHVFKARRARSLERLNLRNLRDDFLYIYSVKNVGKKEAILELLESHKSPQIAPPKGHLIWAIIDPVIIEKTLPFLNELNLAKITFFYADFSQAHFKLDLARCERILQASCQQCGRARLMELLVQKNLQDVLQNYTNVNVMDFGGRAFSELKSSQNTPLLLGPEGGFSQSERAALQGFSRYSLQGGNILRSQTAAIFAASHMLG